ncbi:MAG TPA: PAC2 family protein, partial [Syntrophales bacterium]|nr:PAC2 family protein [Syntrophales bacterium]
INGGAIGKEAMLDLKRSEARQSHYEGPTSIATLITQQAPEFGMETIWLIVSLPQYVVLEEDYIGKLRLMEVLNLLYHIPIDRRDYERAVEQRGMINQKVEKTTELKGILPQLEALYEVRINKGQGERRPDLSPEAEEILWKIVGKEPGKA